MPKRRSSRDTAQQTTIALRINNDLLRIIDTHVEYMAMTNPDDPKSRSRAIRDLVRRGDKYTRAEQAVDGPALPTPLREVRQGVGKTVLYQNAQ